MNRCYSTRPHLKDEFRATVKGKAAPQPFVFSDEDHDIVVTEKESIKSWLKIPKSELMNKRRSKKKWRAMMQLDTIEGREKVEWLKEARDYSFLSSDSDITTSCENIIIPQVRRCPVVSSVIDRPRNNILRRPVKKSIVKEKAPVSKKELLVSKNYSKKETLISKEDFILPAKKKKNPLLCQESRKRKLVVHDEEDEDEEISTPIFPDEKEPTIRVPTKFSNDKEPVTRVPTKFSDDKEPVTRVPTKFSDENEEAKTEAINFADIEKEETRSAKIAKITDDDRQQEVITTTKKSLRIRINLKTGVLLMV